MTAATAPAGPDVVGAVAVLALTLTADAVVVPAAPPEEG